MQLATIQQLAYRTGFDACGAAVARRLEHDGQFMDQWVDEGLSGNMTYLSANRDKRYDIRALVPGAQTVVVCLLHYAHSGHDYHRTVKSKLYELQQRIEQALKDADEYTPEWVNSQAQHIFCDSAPVLERRWAQLAGLGYIGYNHQFIHPDLGSMVHPGELVLNIPIEGAAASEQILPMGAECGTCRACINACPGQALGQAQWDPRRCIAYVTHKCTICQEVCPKNKHLDI